ncbi:MAG: glycosyltransferase [Planctomycetaceae bacterium]|nr:glycosyltransferase [Planctomycetaceae bacterium]
MIVSTPQLPASQKSQSIATAASAERCHLLTVNVEDYFQVGAFQQFIRAETWYRFESRLKQNVEQVLELLDTHSTKATFFVLGWTAEKEPELIRAIADAGHEIASRGYLHQPVQNLSREEVRDDFYRAKCVIEDLTGHAVDGFRLSDGWLNKESLWLLDEIAAVGHRYDSSLMPTRRDFGDDPSWRTIRPVETANGPILEIPLSTLPVPGAWMPVAGGNYQRQIPNFLMQRLVGRCVEQQTNPFVMYFQVWELDSHQPRLSVADRMTRVRHYRKLGKYRRILPQYLSAYQFTSIQDHAELRGSPLRELKQPATIQNPLAAELERRRIASTHLNDGVGTNRVSRHLAPEQIASRIDAGPADSSRKAVDRIPVTLVIPCYNEESSLSYLANTLSSVLDCLSDNYDARVLFVDDCSRDRTVEQLQKLFGSDPAVRIVRHTENKGVSAAILTGIRQADTDIVCSMDCDCSYDPHELKNMLPLLTDDVAMVTASPYHGAGHVRNVPAWRLVLSRGLSAMYQVLLQHDMATWTSCFRVYRRDQILDLPLRENGFLGTAELAAHLTLNQRVISEYPATLEVRLFGLSKMKTVKAILSHLRLLGRIAVLRFSRRKTALSK